ncbi:hypothetical protein F5148DRAFT_34436 [Russula earlei]|uniref:Uncharacterized protein n=1 Tax=Russula earlei TaxID=71964 RepID=A0ACC0TSU8_9AGAM|nr:hypothetical protein F5148DRAFT_34436 [Russula earlei]
MHSFAPQCPLLYNRLQHVWRLQCKTKMVMSTILCNHEPATEWPAPLRCQSHQSAGEWSMRVTRISSPTLQAAFFAHDHSRVRVRTPSPHSNGPGSTAVMTQSSRRSMGVSPFEFSSRGAHVRGHLQAHREPFSRLPKPPNITGLYFATHTTLSPTDVVSYRCVRAMRGRRIRTGNPDDT